MATRIRVLLLLFGSLSPRAAADPADDVRRGNELMRSGRYAEAIIAYSDAVSKLPNDAGLRTNLGMAYHQAGRDAEAIQQFERALKLQDGILPAMVMAGASWMRLGQPSRAIPYLRKAVGAAPELVDVQAMLAQALAATGNCEDAMAAFRKWTANAPRTATAWYGTGRCYEALALESAWQVEAQAPRSAYALALDAEERFQAGDHAAAFRLYRQALGMLPRPGGLHLAIAEIYRATGHAEWAGAERQKERTTAAGGCSGSKPECDYLGGRYEAAVALPAGNRDPEIWYWRTRSLRALAQAAFRQAESLPSAEAHAVRATRARQRGTYSDAIREWKMALERAPGNPEFERELATTLRMNEDYAAAQPIVERLLKQSPDSGDLNYLMGHLLLRQQQPAAALPYLQRGVRLAPEFLPVRSSLGLALLEVGRYTDAIPHLKAALPLDRDGNLHFRLARAFQRVGDADSAKVALERYRKIQSRAEAQRAVAAPGAITPP
jgi:tetratricopeptide (TPR) repeat protein